MDSFYRQTIVACATGSWERLVELILEATRRSIVQDKTHLVIIKIIPHYLQIDTEWDWALVAKALELCTWRKTDPTVKTVTGLHLLCSCSILFWCRASVILQYERPLQASTRRSILNHERSSLPSNAIVDLKSACVAAGNTHCSGILDYRLDISFSSLHGTLLADCFNPLGLDRRSRFTFQAAIQSFASCFLCSNVSAPPLAALS